MGIEETLGDQQFKPLVYQEDADFAMVTYLPYSENIEVMKK